MEKNQNLSTKNSELTIINTPGIGKRLVTAIIDAAIFCFTWLILALWVFTPISDAGFDYSTKQANGQQYQIASRLYVFEETQDNGDVLIIDTNNLHEMNSGASRNLTALYFYDSSDINFFIERIRYFYCNYQVNRNISFPTDGNNYDAVKDMFCDPNYEANRLVLDEKDPLWFDNEILEINGESPLFNAKGDGTYTLIKEEKLNDAISLLKDKAYSAAKTFFESEVISTLNTQLSWIQIFIVVCPYVISFLVYYLLLPLIFVDGQTLGKKFTKLAVLSKDCYQAKKRQIVFRQLVLFVCLTIPGFILGLGLTSIVMIFVTIFIALLVVLLNKNNKAFHDFAALTLVVDSSTSVYFKDPEDEAKHERELQEKMAEYKSHKVENSNVIQVGKQIIDQEFLNNIDQKNSK